MKFLIIFFSLFLFSCGQLIPTIFQPDPSTHYPPQQGDLGPAGPPIIQGPVTNIGVVKCQNSSETNLFNKRLQAFLSTNTDPSRIGNHSCTKDRPGGVFFRGQVVTDKPVSPSGYNQDLIVDPEKSYMEFIFETFSKNIGNVAPIALRYTYGSIEKQHAILTFEDHKGEVHLDGQIITHSSGKILFTGNIRFNNYTSWDGKTGISGILGDFSIEACNFFQC